MVDGGHERQPDHLGLVRKHLGPMPPPERPTDLSLWVGAYVNPLPALGVALEIRPLLLRATTARQLCGNHSARRRGEVLISTQAKERVDAAVAGIASSIAHLDGSRRLW